MLWVKLWSMATFVLLTMQPAAIANQIDKFRDLGDGHYASGDFQAATTHYALALSELGKQSASNGHLLYNLANAHYRLGQYGQAATNYRRALLFLPNNRDVKANYQTVLNKLKLEEQQPKNTLFFWLPFTSFKVALWLTLLGLGLLFILVGTYVLFKNRKVKLAALFSAMVSVVLLCAFVLKTVELQRPIATVIDNNAELKSGRGDTFVAIASIDEGSTVEIVEYNETWSKVQIGRSGGSETLRGWMKTAHLIALNRWQFVRGTNLSDLFFKEYDLDSFDTTRP